MNIDEQIYIAKDEKSFNESVDSLMSGLYEIEKRTKNEDISESAIYEMYYSDCGENLANYDYNLAMNTLRQKDSLTIMEAIKLERITGVPFVQLVEGGKTEYYKSVAKINNMIKENLETIKTCKDCNKLIESYKTLAKIKTLLESVKIAPKDDQATIMKKLNDGIQSGNADAATKAKYQKEYDDYVAKNKK